MADIKNDRRQEILQAARNEFIKEGISGARTQAIADHIGVTKAMIHYYFKTKENLFKEVFRQASKSFIDGLLDPLEREGPLFKKIEAFIDQLINRLENNPELAGFITNELRRHNEITAPIFRDACNIETTVFARQLEEAASDYEIAPVTPDQVIINIFSLCAFPYVGRGLLKGLLKKQNSQQYQSLLNERREMVKDTVINWLAG